MKTITICGAAYEFDYGIFNRVSAPYFIYQLTVDLLKKDFNIRCGTGLRVQEFVSFGVNSYYDLPENVYCNKNRYKWYNFNSFLQGEKKEVQYQELRDQMFEGADAAIFLFGNKLGKNSVLLNSDGMMKEYDTALKKNVPVIPVGFTGYMSSKIHEKEYERLSYQGNSSENLIYLRGLNDKRIERIEDAVSAVQYYVDFLMESK